MSKLSALVAALSIAMSGCAPGGEMADEAGDAAMVTTVPSEGLIAPFDASLIESSDSTGPPDQHDADVRRLVDAAVADLVHRMSVQISDIVVLSVESAQGDPVLEVCPETNTPIRTETEGVAIELAVDGISYWYRQVSTDGIHLCVGDDLMNTGPGSHLIPPTTTP